MSMLKKSLTLYERDEKGKLIPQPVPLELAKQDQRKYPELVETEISIIPLTRGELKKIFGFGGKVMDEKPETDKDTDAEIIVEHCFEPLYTKEELVYAKPVVVRSIVRTILSESGVKMDDDAGTGRIDDEDKFGKNLGESEKKGKKGN